MNRRTTIIPLLLAAALAHPLAAQQPPEAPEGEQIVLIQAFDDLPERCLKSEWSRARFRVLREPLENLPEGYRLKVTLRKFYDQGNAASSNDFEPYAAAFVPVDPEGKNDGVEVAGNQRITWENGVRNGPQIILKGKNKVASIPWKNGVIEGTKKTFFPDGSVKSETPYVDGKPHGVSKTYAKDGTVTRSCTLKVGRRDGTLVDYWPGTGNKRRIVTYDDGAVTGTVKTFYRNGQPRQEIPFINDTMHGEEKRYTEDGKPDESRYWLDGNLVSKTEYMLQSE